MPKHIYQVDAFSSSLFKGNPAAVVILNNWLDEELMQNIAAENNLAETAFVSPSGTDLHIRWFTPTTEVDLCGHATLAAAHVLFNHEDLEGDEVVFHSKSGLLRVMKEEEHLILDFPLDEFESVVELPELMKLDFRDKTQEIYKGKTDIMFVLGKESDVAQYQPNFDIISQLDCRGIIITAPGNDVDFVSRFFAPQSGINEDPVTGSAHTTLTPYWSKRLNTTKLKAKQLSKRGGMLCCEVKDGRAMIGGSCHTFFKGELYI
ncbi:PhzF family phenazine biosynthesis protein [Labilibacter marinus]|uniref:PhzF family phenazine biosynthesis protein n=1 Tax=Labilibacter marinus TaxID=1477105 RepID=UPI0008345753|nr:PhzF family phenazine biosynthesis protein [Labilibacter marinus]